MGWADDTMELPDNGLIKNASPRFIHEQRLCFPLDSLAAATELTQVMLRKWFYLECTPILVEVIHREIKVKLLGSNDKLFIITNCFA